jgi:hypothetical protein
MTLQEFKAWFDGFTENINGVPSKKQWERIKERDGQINGVAVTREVYYEWWPRYWTTAPVWINTPTSSTTDAGSITTSSTSYMLQLGQAESATL